ncbi:MAG: acyltransferase family protein [Duganella sp.]
MDKSSVAGFRNDINGLRAWAVIAVVLYHFKISGFDGGFVGVDVFFVISGFLMTGIIARALENGAGATPIAFLWKFFIARAKRIWPALIVLCAVLLLLGWFLIPAKDLSILAEQARSAIFFVSNVKFWRETGYFSAGAHTIWLLHTWSLSVEWQFYVILPFMMLAIWKIFPSRRAMLWMLIVLGSASLALCMIWVLKKPGTAFFLLPTRAWEMVAGGVVALLAQRPPASVGARRVLEWGGLGLIALSILTFGHLIWPGWQALVPVIGTVMVLMAAQQNSMLTNWAPLRWIGARSYSMYLWHWPLVVALNFLAEPPSTLAIGTGLLLTVLLGHLSYELVETRLRQPLDGMKRTPASAALVAGCLLIVLPATVLNVNAGFPRHIPDAVNNMLAAAEDTSKVLKDCDILNHGNDNGCALGTGTPGVIVLGDSHAKALFEAVQQAQPESQRSSLRWTMEGCPTIEGVQNVSNPSMGCDKFMRWVMQNIPLVPSDVPVVIINRMALYMEGSNELVHDEDLTRPNISFEKRFNARSPEFYADITQRMVATACAISKYHPVYMVRPVPEMRVDVPNTLAHSMMLGKQRKIEMTMDEYTRRNAMVWKAQDLASARCGVKILDPLPYLCVNGVCNAVNEGRSLYSDDDHLNLHGARRLTPMFQTIFRPASPHDTAQAL